jgi:hypothetical protein
MCRDQEERIFKIGRKTRTLKIGEIRCRYTGPSSLKGFKIYFFLYFFILVNFCMHCSVTYTGNVLYSISALVSGTAVLYALTASLSNAGQLILVNYEDISCLRYCCWSTAIRLLDEGQLLSQLLLQVKPTAASQVNYTVSVTATGQRLSHLMWQKHTNSFWFRYCCWSNAVPVITAGQLPSHLLLQVNCCFSCHCWSTAVSVATAGQLLSKLLLHVNSGL